jgi:hypothetical protein
MTKLDENLPVEVVPDFTNPCEYNGGTVIGETQRGEPESQGLTLCTFPPIPSMFINKDVIFTF